MASIQGTLGIGTIWKRFKKNRVALFGSMIVMAIFAISVAAPVVSPYDPRDTSWEVLSPPSEMHWFGTDQIGRDVLSRCLWGAGNSLVVGLGASLFTTIIGLMIGAFSGYFTGAVDFILMRVSDVVLILPGYFFYILAISVLRSKDTFLIVALMSVLMWPRVARIVRSEFLSLREMDYVRSAKALGAGHGRVIFRHLIPNAMGSIIVVTTMNISAAILLESGLSFLGLTDPTIIGWGSMLSGGRGVLGSAWWVATFPGFFIFLTVLAFNLLGDGLRDALDPRLRGVRV